MDKLICPDCQTNELKTEMEQKDIICKSCKQRKMICSIHNKPYIRFIDLPQEEKDRLLRQRANMNRYLEKKKVKNQSKEESVTITKSETKPTIKTSNRKNNYSEEFHQICSKDGSRSLKEIFEEITNTLPEYSNLQYKTLWGFMRRNNYPYTVDKSNLGRSKISKVIEDQIEIPDNIIKEEEIDEPIIIEDSLADTNEIISNPNIKLDLENIDLKYKEEIDENINKTEPTRFIPIREEVNEVLSCKYKNLNCTTERNYTTEDYINMLEMLSYLIENCETIIKARNDQHDILNAYQSDTIHECENVIAEDGDTYLQDKLHILRKERRYYEYDCNDLTVLNHLLKTFNKLSIDRVLALLKETYAKRQSPKFIPLVDYSMIGKYDWAINGDANSKKLQKPILTTNNNKRRNRNNYSTGINTNINIAQESINQANQSSNLVKNTKNTLKKFKVTAELCGCGLGVFKPWSNEYMCLNEDYAKQWAKNSLEELINRPEHKGAYYTNLRVQQVNN